MRLCPICQAGPSEFNKAYLECPGCRLLFCGEIPALNRLEFMYDGGWLRGLRRKLFNRFRKMWTLRGRRRFRARAERIFSVLRGYAPDGDVTYLDIGCHKGYLLEAASEGGWNAYGIEISRQQIRPFLNTYPHMRENVEIAPFPAGAAGFADGRFDVATAIDVIEHFCEPRESFAEILRVLKPGGCIVVQTPDTASAQARQGGPNWHALKPMEHMHLFDAENLDRLAREAGFRSVDVLPESLDAPQFNLSAVLHK